MLIKIAFLYLFGELFLAQFIQGVKFSGQSDVFQKTATRKFHADDNLSVRNHHRHCTELYFQVFWELLPSSVTRVLQFYWLLKNHA